MTPDNMVAVFDELDDLLDAEREALLNGRLEEVGRLYDRKSRLIDVLANLEPISGQDPALLRDKLERNQDLLESASEGVRSVARRLAAIRRVRESLETYDARGRRKTVELKPGGALEKRA